MSPNLTRLQLCLLRLLCCGAAVFTSTSMAQIYGGVGNDGSVVLSNFRTEETRTIIVDDVHPRSGVTTVPGVKPDPRLSALIQKAARSTELPSGLLHAVISVESGFKERAVSPKGAKGLMQLMPATASALGVNDPFDPEQNINAGASHLKSLLNRFDNNLELALAAYNAGADAVVRAGYQIPRFAETRAYVPRVIDRYRRGNAAMDQYDVTPAGEGSSRSACAPTEPNGHCRDSR